MSVRWLLYFEFITGRYTKNGEISQTVEPLVWNLPLRVLVPYKPAEPIYKSKHFALLN